MVADRLPPHNTDAEESVLGSILIDGHCIRKVANQLKFSDFYSERNRWVFEACHNLYQNRVGIDQVTVAHELSNKERLESCGGAAYLSHLIVVVPTSLDVEYYADIVKRLSSARELIEMADRIQEIGYQDTGSIGNLIDKTSVLWDTYRKNNFPVSSKLTTPIQAANDVLEMMNTYSEPANAPSWGFANLDSITAGIFPEYIIFGARPSIGKTQLLLDITEAQIRARRHVLFASAEMTKNQVYERRISREVKLSILSLRKFGIPEEKKEALMNLSGMMSEETLHLLSGGLSFNDIYTEAFNLKDRGLLDILIIDYIGALLDCYKENRDSQTTRISRISNNIQKMTHDFGIPILVACQLNRELEKTTTTGFKEPQKHRRPQLSDLRDSGSLEQDADGVFMLDRRLDEAGEMTPLLDVKMAKNRQLGPAKSVTLLYNYNLNHYVDYAEKNEVEE